MIQNPAHGHRDRLCAFFDAFELSSAPAEGEIEPDAARLVVTAMPDGEPDCVVLCSRGDPHRPRHTVVVAEVRVAFGGATNPLMNAMPDSYCVRLDAAPHLRSIVSVLLQEMRGTRCGRQAAIDSLCGVIVLMVLRRAVETGTTGPGLLAGLSHPLLHRALVAMHDTPARAWRIEQLAEISGLSRSHFIALFAKVIGTTPGAYLTSWRLALGRRALIRGTQVKAAARLVGFGSAAAFSRAYSRAYGCSPAEVSGSARLPAVHPTGA